MKKFLSLSLILFFAVILTARAQDNAEFYQNILFTEEVGIDKKTAEAEAQAKKLLEAKPQSLRKNKFPELRKSPKGRNTKSGSQPQASTSGRNTANAAAIEGSPAPFGLVWGAGIAETKDLGVILSKIDEKDYVNNFTATHLPKPISDFTRIDLTFGQENELWRILAYGKLIDDDKDASKVLTLYKIYYKLLNKKYGGAEEHFTPQVLEVEKKDARGKTVTEKVEQPMGGDNFLEALQSGEAVLYATFQNKEVGAALAVSVDGDGKSYIVIDYKNIKILQARENKALEAL